MSAVKLTSVQLGQSSTTANNYVLSVPTTPDGTIKLSKGVLGSTTTDVLSISASGVASFAAVPQVGGLPFTSGIGKVTHNMFNNFVTINTSTWVSTGFSITVSPASAASKYLITTSLSVGASGGNEGMAVKLYRNGAPILVNGVETPRGIANPTYPLQDRAWFKATAAESYGFENGTAMFLDTPNLTGTIVYTIYARAHSASYPCYINTVESGNNSDTTTTATSSITAFEVLGS